MNLNKIAVLTSEESWFVPYAKELVNKLGGNAKFFTKHEDVPEDFEVVFILSYFEIIPQKNLEKYKHCLVVHESNLPEGRGWSPLFWQIIEGKNNIPIVLFEANESADSGDIYLRDEIKLDGHELHNEIREKQAKKTMELCMKFIINYPSLVPERQKGNPSFYGKRTRESSELNPEKSIAEQFNLLRTVNNEKFPAFFIHDGQKYIISIHKDENTNR